MNGLAFILLRLWQWRLEGTPEDVCEAVEWQARILYAKQVLER